jgi:penicillin-binding protein 2
MNEGNSRFRLGVVGVIVLALFSGLLARLWFLQVADSKGFAAQTERNRVRTLKDPPVRGSILDDKGNPVVQNTLVDEITVKRGLTAEQTDIMAKNLGSLLLRSKKSILDDMNSPRFSPYEPVVVAKKIDYDSLVYIEEHPELFPGVEATRRTTRDYAFGDLGSHLIGYVAAINKNELKLRKGEGYGQSDQIGKQGVEQLFETELRGVPRTRKLEVDSRGRFVQVLSDTPAQAGHDVQLTMDAGVQKIAEESLAQGMLGARRLRSTTGNGGLLKADGGAVVVLNANDGSVVALASAPTYPVSQFTNGIPADEFQKLTDPAQSNYPLIDRATQGLYAPGSTFKLISSIAGLEDGAITPDYSYNDRGFIDVGNGQKLYNAQHESHGFVTVKRALTVSSDVFFFNLGFQVWREHQADKESTDPKSPIYAIQQTAHEFGFGAATGIGLPDEARGRIPDLNFKNQFNQNNPDPGSKVWLPGDNMNVAVGQGDVLVTPLQLATAYAAFANGGTLYQPRVASKILENSGVAGAGKVIRDLPSQPIAKIKIPDEVRKPILEGLEGAVCDPEGTAYAAFQDYICGTVAGKTGTAQTSHNQQDNALFCGFSPAEPPAADSGQPQYVVCVVVEHGGFGGSVAAPIARRIFDYLGGNTNPAPVKLAPTSATRND